MDDGRSRAHDSSTVVRVKPSRWQLVLEVSFLGARLEVEVDERLVEKVLDSRPETSDPRRG